MPPDKNQKFNHMRKFFLLFSLVLLATGIYAQNTKVDTLFKDGDDQKAERLYNEGITLFDAGQFMQALSKFNESIQEKPSFEKAIFNRGVVKIELKDYTGAITDFDKSIQLSPSAKAYFNRGKAKHELSDRDGAFADYSKAIELDANFAPAYYYRGGLYFEKGEYDLAIGDFTHRNSNKI